MKTSKRLSGLLFLIIVMILTGCMEKKETVKQTIVVEQETKEEKETQRIPNMEANGPADYVYREMMEQLNFFIDTRQWQEAYYAEGEGQALAEFILVEETIDTWSELFSIHYFENGYTNIGIENYIANMEQNLRASVTGDITFHVLDWTEKDAVYEFTVGNDPNELDQHEVARIFTYNNHLFLIRYTTLGLPMDEADKLEWINRLKQASVLSGDV
jgi:hypothetical protein